MTILAIILQILGGMALAGLAFCLFLFGREQVLEWQARRAAREEEIAEYAELYSLVVTEAARLAGELCAGTSEPVDGQGE